MNDARWGVAAAGLAALSIWPLGSGRPVFWAAIGVLLCCVLILDLIQQGRPPHLPAKALKASALSIGALLIWALLQAAPISPSGIAHPAWALKAEAFGAPAPALAPISANPVASMRAALLGFLVMAFAAGGLMAGRRRPSAYLALNFILGSITLAAATAFLLTLIGNPFPWLTERWAYFDRAAGPFVNPNMFGYVCAVGVLTSASLAGRALMKTVHLDAGWRVALADMVNALPGRLGYYLLCFTICSQALLITASRNAVISLIAAGAVMVIAITIANRGRGITAALGAAGAALILLLSPAGGLLADRFAWITESNRAEIYVDIWTAIQANPLLGHGLGAFADSFPSYQTFLLPGGAPVVYAHSLWLGLAFDLGLPAMGLAITAMVGLMVHLGGNYVRRRSALDALALGLVVLFVVFGLADDALQTPATGFVTAFAIGLAAGSRRRWR